MPKHPYHSKFLILSELMAGFVSSMLMIIMAILVSAIIFKGPLLKYFSIGLISTLFGSALLNLITARWGSLKYGISRIEPAVGTIVAAIFTQILANNVDDQVLLPTLLATFATISFSTGVAMFLFGYFNISQASRFLPYPVLGGIIVSVAWVMATSCYHLMPIHALGISDFFYSAEIIQWAIPIVMIAILHAFSKNDERLWLMPFLILVLTIVINIYLSFGYATYQESVQAGWLFPGLAINLKNFQQFNLLSVINLADWPIILKEIGYILLLVTLIIIIQILNMSSLEIYAEKKLDIESDFKIYGMGNVINSIFCLFPGNISLTGSILNNNIGGKYRLSAVLTSAISLFVILTFPSLLNYIPKPLVVGLLFYISSKILIEWLYQGYQKLPFEDYLTILFILISVITWGLLIGFIIGLILTCLFFIIRYSRLDVVRVSMNGSEYRSNVIRPIYQQKILSDEGYQIQIIRLQGYIFFGSIKGLIDKILNITNLKCINFIILDFEFVNGLDSSTSYNFIRFMKYCKKSKKNLIFTHCSKKLLSQLKKQRVIDESDNVYIFRSLDHGLEWCEDMILHTKNINSENINTSIKVIMKDILHHDDDIKLIIDNLQKIILQPKMHLFEQDDEGYSMYFLESGEMSVILYDKDKSSSIRLSKVGPGSIMGELGLFTNGKRSATVIAETTCVIYKLSQASLKELEKSNPNVIISFQKGILNIISEKLIKTNRFLQLNQLCNKDNI